MPLKYKVRKTGESLAITLPSQIAALHGIHEGDYVEFTPIGTGEFRKKKRGPSLDHVISIMNFSAINLVCSIDASYIGIL